MAHFRHTPHIADIEKQIHWEMQGIERGALQVRKQMDAQKVGNGELGLRIMRHAAPKLVAQIEASQKSAMEGIERGGRGRPQLWWWLILLLPADQLAAITLKSILSEKPREFTFNIPITNVAANISRHTWTQVDYETWKAEEAAKAKADSSHSNLHFQYLRSTKQVDEQSFKRFSERIHRTRMEKWEHSVGVAFGCKLIQLLTEAVPEWFTVQENRIRGGKVEKQLMFSDECKEVMADVAEQCELSRPMLLPMITPPADWRIAT